MISRKIVLNLLTIFIAVTAARPAVSSAGVVTTDEIETLVVNDQTAVPTLAPAVDAARALDHIVDCARGRMAPRPVSAAEAATTRFAVEYLFADRSKAYRRRVLDRTLNVAATGEKPVSDARAISSLVEVIAGAIERAASHPRRGDATGPSDQVRDDVRTAMAGIGWAFRVLGVSPVSPELIATRKMKFLYTATKMSSVACAATVIAMPLLHAPLGIRLTALSWALAQLMFDIVIGVDYGTDGEWAEAWSKPFTFVEVRATRDTIAKRTAEFWYELENRLSQREEWRAFVKSRAHQPGVGAIASDVREYLVEVLGAEGLGEACEDLLAPAAFPSPFY